MSKKLSVITGKLTDELLVLSITIELMGSEKVDTSRLLRQCAEAAGRCRELLAAHWLSQRLTRPAEPNGNQIRPAQR